MLPSTRDDWSSPETVSDVNKMAASHDDVISGVTFADSDVDSDNDGSRRVEITATDTQTDTPGECTIIYLVTQQ